MNEPRTFNIRGTGLRCGNCGEVLTSVEDSRRTEGLIIRRRYCQCGHVNETIERVIGSHALQRKMNQQHD
jgi:transcriptional regulator NrdR family protein